MVNSATKNGLKVYVWLHSCQLTELTRKVRLLSLQSVCLYPQQVEARHNIGRRNGHTYISSFGSASNFSGIDDSCGQGGVYNRPVTISENLNRVDMLLVKHAKKQWRLVCPQNKQTPFKLV